MKPSPRCLHGNRRLKHILMPTSLSKSITIGSVFLKEAIRVRADGGPKTVQVKTKQRFRRVLFFFTDFEHLRVCVPVHPSNSLITAVQQKWFSLTSQGRSINEISLAPTLFTRALYLCAPRTVLLWAGFNICCDAFRRVIGKRAANKTASV